MLYVLYVVFLYTITFEVHTTLESCKIAEQAVITNLFNGTVPEYARVTCEVVNDG